MILNSEFLVANLRNRCVTKTLFFCKKISVFF